MKKILKELIYIYEIAALVICIIISIAICASPIIFACLFEKWWIASFVCISFPPECLLVNYCLDLIELIVIKKVVEELKF